MRWRTSHELSTKAQSIPHWGRTTFWVGGKAGDGNSGTFFITFEPNGATKAMAAKLARLIYRKLRYGMKYVNMKDYPLALNEDFGSY
jgi:hypothetical protein